MRMHLRCYLPSRAEVRCEPRRLAGAHLPASSAASARKPDPRRRARFSGLLPVHALLLAGLHLLAPAPAAAQTAPSVPRNVHVASGDGKLTLTWDAPSSWGSWTALGYELQSKRSAETSWQVVRSFTRAVGDLRRFEYTGSQGDGGGAFTVTNGVSYDLRLRAVSQQPGSQGTQDSHFLRSAWVTVSNKVPAAAQQAVPRSVVVTPGVEKLTITWQAPTSWAGTLFRSFFVEWKPSTASATAWTLANEDGVTAVISSTDTSFEFAGYQIAPGISTTVAGGDAYDLRIRASSTDQTTTHNSSWVTLSNNVPLEPPIPNRPQLSGLTLSVGGNEVNYSPALGATNANGRLIKTHSVTVPYDTLGLTVTPTWSNNRITATVRSVDYRNDSTVYTASTSVSSGGSVTVGLNRGKLPEDLTRVEIHLAGGRNKSWYEVIVSKGGEPIEASISVSPATVNEGASKEGASATVTVTLSQPAPEDMVILLALGASGDTAEDGDWYISVPSVMIRRGSTTDTGDTFIRALQDDDTDDETLTVSLGTLPAPLTAGTPSSAIVTFKDGSSGIGGLPESVSTVSLSAEPNPVDEGSAVTVTATLSTARSSDVTIPLTLTDGTAEAGDRGTLAGITIPAGDLSASGRITTTDDTDADDERFTVALDTGNLPSDVVAVSPSSVDVTITDGDNTSPQGTGPYAALITKMYEWRNDSCCVHNKAHTDRWDRALLAFGETVSDSSLTPMSAAEAQGYADRGWTRWVEVAAALWEIEGGSPDPVVTIAAGAAVTEGAPAGFTLSAAPAPAADLAVTVTVAQTGAVADASALGERTVTIPAGTASADFTVATVDDDADETDGAIVATLAAGDGYRVGDASGATVKVADDDEEDDPGIVTRRSIAREEDHAVVFTVRLDRPASHTVTVDYATADGAGAWAGTPPARAGVDYTANSGTLSFAAGETSKSVPVHIMDDLVDEGSEYFLLRFSNPQGATLEAGRREVEGIIRNTDPIPAALLARFGRATAEQVVEHIEERMAAPRQRGFRARFAGRELQPGSERAFALGFLSQFARPMGAGQAVAAPMGGALVGAAPMAMGSQAAGAGALGAGMGGMNGAMGTTGMGGMHMTGMNMTGMNMTGMGMGGMAGAMGMAGGQPPMDGAHGGGLFGSMLGGGDPFSNSEFELNRESRGGILSVWSRSSRSYFSGVDDALSLNGDARTTMFGADYSRGALTVGLSVGRTLGLGGYSGRSGGQMSTSMTGFYPWVGYQVNDRVSVWGVTGYGGGGMSLTPNGASALETGVSMAMSAVGTRGELIGSRATGGFALAFKADALRVGAGSSELLDGPTGRLSASEAGVTRVRTALAGSRGFTLGGGRLSLRPSVEVGLRRDGGDAETGAGMDVGGGLSFTDTVTGLSLDVRVRTLVVHQADGFTERGMSLSLGWDPTPSSPLGLTARVAPSWGGQATGGAEALWGNQMAYGMGSHQMYGAGGQVDAEVGYGLPVGARFVGTPRVGVATSQYGRDYRVGYGLGVLDRGDVNFELGVDAQRRESPMQGETSNGFMGRASLGW